MNAMRPASRPALGDAAVTLAALALVLLWDAAGADLAVSRWFANEQGFALRSAPWATLLHDGGRIAAWALLAALVLLAAWLRPPPGRWTWLAVMAACALAVPAIKHFSATSCPWELAEFGGAARYVGHWHWGVSDGGPGHCFPSGHAVSAFAFFGQYFAWRGHDRRRAGLWLAGVLVVGAAFGFAQLARGAHYVSHTLWSAWLCWALCGAAAAALRWRENARLQLRGA